MTNHFNDKVVPLIFTVQQLIYVVPREKIIGWGRETYLYSVMTNLIYSYVKRDRSDLCRKTRLNLQVCTGVI